jgi:hypothetical protein
VSKDRTHRRTAKTQGTTRNGSAAEPDTPSDK